MVSLGVRTSEYLQILCQVIYYLPLRFEWRINCNKRPSFFHCPIRGVWGCVWIALGSRKYSRSNDKFGLGLRRGIMRNNRSTYFLLCSLSRTISRLLCSHCLYRDTFVYIFVRKNDFVNSNECRKLELLRIWSREPDLCGPHRNGKCGIAFQP